MTHPTNRNLERGAIGKGCLIAVGAVVLLALIFGGMLIGKYNGLVARQELTEAAWSEIDNQYKRRYDLVPQLVKTVKGAADFEESVLTQVTEARASVANMKMPEAPTDPAQLDAYIAAQDKLGASLGRLLLVAERYPDLKATAGFRDLQTQLEGTENRIAVARRDYIDAVKSYNTSIRSFPTNLLASSFGFEKKAQPTVEESDREVPDIDFGGEKE